jgi:hypothetical protein
MVCLQVTLLASEFSLLTCGGFANPLYPLAYTGVLLNYRKLTLNCTLLMGFCKCLIAKQRRIRPLRTRVDNAIARVQASRMASVVNVGERFYRRKPCVQFDRHDHRVDLDKETIDKGNRDARDPRQAGCASKVASPRWRARSPPVALRERPQSSSAPIMPITAVASRNITHVRSRFWP